MTNIPNPGANDDLIKMAAEAQAMLEAEQEKRAVIPVGDPAMMAGDPMAGGGAPPPGGGMPPGPPPPGGGMPPPGGDPMAGGPPPPPGGDPMAGGGPDIMAMITQAVQAAMAGQGGAAGGAGGIKPKIDVNVEIMQMKKILAKISDSLGIQIPAADMVATPEDLSALAEGGAGAGAMAGEGDGAGDPSAIQPPQPIEGMPAATPEAPKMASHPNMNRVNNGRPAGAEASAKFAAAGNRAEAVSMIMKRK